MPTAQGITIDGSSFVFIFLSFLIYEVICGAASYLLAGLVARRPNIFGPLLAVAILGLLGWFLRYLFVLAGGWNDSNALIAALVIVAVFLASVHGYSLHYAVRHRPYLPYLLSAPLCVALSGIAFLPSIPAIVHPRIGSCFSGFVLSSVRR